jgi:membrane fusion protein (multidrug efflux system)
MRVGQPVTLTADLYGRSVHYHGTVAGFGAGTGSAFALLPAQNATGNWIKIVQRVPVRIALDPRELAAHPLQIGLSMTAEVDTHDRSGPRLSQLAQSAPAYETGVFHANDSLADARVAAIIVANEPAVVRDAAARLAPRAPAAAKPVRLARVGQTAAAGAPPL